MTRQGLKDYPHILVVRWKLSGASIRRSLLSLPMSESLQRRVPGLGVDNPIWLPAELACSKLCACKQQDELLDTPLLQSRECPCNFLPPQQAVHIITQRFLHVQAAEEHKRLRAEDDATVKALAAQKAAFEPRWCERTPVDKSQIGKQYLYRYKGGYWEERAAKHKA